MHCGCRKLLKEISVSNETRILLDCAADRVLATLQQAREVNMISVYHSYFITSLVSASHARLRRHVTSRHHALADRRRCFRTHTRST